MRALIITMGVSKILPAIFSSRHEVVGIAECAPRAYQERSKITKFIRGVAGFIGEKRTLSDFSEKAGIPYFRIIKNGKGLKRWVVEKDPDVIIVQGMTMLLKIDVLRIPRYGVINLHRSYLPEYRGPNPLFWQYYDGRTDFGITVHFIDRGEDTGDIIERQKVSFEVGATEKEVNDKLVGGIGSKMLVSAMNSIEEGGVSRIQQTATGSPTGRARNITLDEHKKIVPWEVWPVERVWHLLRGTQSWLDAVDPPSGIFSGQRWCIGPYERSECSSFVPGKIYKGRKGRKFVACQDGVIYLGVKFQFKALLKSALGA